MVNDIMFFGLVQIIAIFFLVETLFVKIQMRFYFVRCICCWTKSSTVGRSGSEKLKTGGKAIEALIDEKTTKVGDVVNSQQEKQKNLTGTASR